MARFTNMAKNWLNPFTISLCLTFTVLYFYSIDLTLFQVFELKSYDFKIRMRGKRPISGQVAIVAIDEKSLKKEGRWPWSRGVMTRLLNRITEAGATVIGIDIFFPEEEDGITMDRFTMEVRKKPDIGRLSKESLIEWFGGINDSDKRFAQAIEHSERTVLGYYVSSLKSDESKKVQASHLKLLDFSQYSIVQRFLENVNDPVPIRSFSSIGMSLPEFMDSANSAGFSSFVPEIDGVIRWVPMAMQHGDLVFPSLSLQLVHEATMLPLAINLYPFGVDKLLLGQTPIPTRENADFLVNYHGPAFTFSHFSAADVLSGKVGAPELANKIILIGGTAGGIHDFHTTPYGPLFPGVEVHANIIESILNNDFLVRPEWLRILDLAMIIGSGVLIGIFAYCFKTYVVALLFVGGLFGYLFMDFYLFTQKGLWINSVYPVFTLTLVYSGVTLYQYGFEERKKRFIKGAFSKYIAPEFVEKLMESPELLKPGGEERFMTILFSDLIGFTSLSEKMSPRELAKFINEYFTEMTAIVLDEKGTVTQYAGDAMMVSFGAPNLLPDHAERAVRVGVKAQRRLGELNKIWSRRGLSKLGCRIGINTGKMLFGNLGSEQVYYYSAMGDNVNLAARLETANKQYGTHIMIAESTHDELKPGQFRSRVLDVVKVKGKSKAVKVYEIYGETTDSIDPELLNYYEIYHTAFEAYLNRNFSIAREKFGLALALRPKDPASRGMIERLKTLDFESLPEEWDGAIALTSK